MTGYGGRFLELYRFIVTIAHKEVPIVAAAESEDQAFQVAEREIAHQLLKKPVITDFALVEKKIITKNGAAYLIQPRQSYE